MGIKDLSLKNRKRDGAAFSFSNFTPKNIILNAVRDRLAGSGITKLTFVFSTIEDKYNVLLSQTDGKAMHVAIEKDDITKIKKIFVSRIHKKFQEISDKEIKAIIIEINLELKDDEIKIFTQDIDRKSVV
jgi:hypothetical protein